MISPSYAKRPNPDVFSHGWEVLDAIQAVLSTVYY